MQTGDIGLQPVDIGLQPGDLGLQPGGLGLQPGGLGLQPGGLGLQPGYPRAAASGLYYCGLPALIEGAKEAIATTSRSAR